MACRAVFLPKIGINAFPLQTERRRPGDAGKSGYPILNYEKRMEQINKIELRGIVGSVRLQHINDKEMAKFTVVTNRAYKNKEGAPVIETQWHNVTAFEGKNVQDLDKIVKGCAVHLTGRLQVQRYNGIDGIERTAVDVICSRLTLLPSDTEMQYEM
jgi:single-strand DNA-binding protein